MKYDPDKDPLIAELKQAIALTQSTIKLFKDINRRQKEINRKFKLESWR